MQISYFPKTLNYLPLKEDKENKKNKIDDKSDDILRQSGVNADFLILKQDVKATYRVLVCTPAHYPPLY